MRPETGTKLKKLLNGKHISIQNVPTGKKGHLFRISVSPGIFHWDEPKNVYQLHPNRNF